MNQNIEQEKGHNSVGHGDINYDCKDAGIKSNTDWEASDGVCYTNHGEESQNTLLQIQEVYVAGIRSSSNKAICLWDAGSTLSFITFKLAEHLKLKGEPLVLNLITVGGVNSKVYSQRYRIKLIDSVGNQVEMEVLGIEQISTDIEEIDLSEVMSKFAKPQALKVQRPSNGCIDLLFGYQYAAYHPIPVEAVGHLLLMENRFGVIVAGSHSDIQENTKKIVKHAVVLHTDVKPDDFYKIESLGVSCIPNCGSCKCGNCHPGGKNMTLQEEKDLMMIEEGLTFNSDTGRWCAKYPWKIDPASLPNNRYIAAATLKSTEKRILRNPIHAETYRRQMNDLLERKVARYVSEDELKTYNGPKHYISHHDVLKPESQSTAMRIVFNSSAKVKGLSLNECLAKGPSLLNNMLGILMRFRQDQFAFIGDISKLFHSIEIPKEDQMTHLFLWRDLQTDQSPKAYAITAVNMGDRPASAIAQTALRKTALEARDIYPEASKLIMNNSYMDDIPGSKESKQVGEQIMSDTEAILEAKGFKMKSWRFSGQQNTVERTKDQIAVQALLKKDDENAIGKVLGMEWDTEEDAIKFMLNGINNSFEESTKRQCLSTVYSIYDPIGLLTPVTIAAKIILRKIWASRPQVGWDDMLPCKIQSEWNSFRSSLSEVPTLSFNRSIKPVGGCQPVLILFSDGSKEAYGVAAYIRWQTPNGFVTNLIAAKSRIAPLKILDVVRLELCGAVLNSRLFSFIKQEMPEIPFSKVYHIVDSEIVKAMINKESYGFNTFAANRIGEIHRNTSPSNWYWIEGSLNVADMTTRAGCTVSEIKKGSIWQCGPEFLRLPEEEWPIFSETNVPKLPEERKQFIGAVKENSSASLTTVIDINRFSKLKLLLHTTARLMKLYKRFKKGGDKDDADILPSDVKLAEELWIKDAQEPLYTDIKKGKYIKLRPHEEAGILRISGRAERWMEATWNQQEFIILPKDHRFSYLIALYEHAAAGHLGVEATVAIIRAKYWIIGIKRIVNSIISKCTDCKRKFKRMAEQKMSPLPIERLKPGPAFNNVGIDYFGPFATKGEVQKRVRGKGYGIIITCDASRAVYLDFVPDYSTPSFLLAIRRFASFRGWPQKIHSDPGSQLGKASVELQTVITGLDWSEIKRFGYQHDTTWSFQPADAPWYNGSTEALVKTTKRALAVVVGDQAFTFSEGLTIMYEVAEIVNERPIGKKPAEPSDGTYLCPNDLLLGRSSSRIPQGPFEDNTKTSDRFKFIQAVVNNFWKRWSREVFPALVIQPKWHVERRNVMEGDVVLVQDSNVVRGEWKMGIITKVTESKDGLVRKADVTYKRDSTSITVSRAVQRLIVLVPIDGEVDSSNSSEGDKEVMTTMVRKFVSGTSHLTITYDQNQHQPQANQTNCKETHQVKIMPEQIQKQFRSNSDVNANMNTTKGHIAKENRCDAFFQGRTVSALNYNTLLTDTEKSINSRNLSGTSSESHPPQYKDSHE